MKPRTKKGLRIAGIFLFSFGLLMMFNPFTSSLTGYAVSNSNLSNPFPIFGFICLIIGGIIFVLGQEKKEQNISELVRESLAESPLPGGIVIPE